MCFEVNGECQNWYWIWWYVGPPFWVNEDETQIVIPSDYLSQIEIFELFDITNSDIFHHFENLTQDKEQGIRLDVSIQDVLNEVANSQTLYYALHNDPEKLMIFDEDELRETNPEWFI